MKARLIFSAKVGPGRFINSLSSMISCLMGEQSDDGSEEMGRILAYEPCKKSSKTLNKQENPKLDV